MVEKPPLFHRYHVFSNPSSDYEQLKTVATIEHYLRFWLICEYVGTYDKNYADCRFSTLIQNRRVRKNCKV